MAVRTQADIPSELLEKLPKITGKGLCLGNDCAICLDVIGNEELARLVPGCNHGFHLECVDLWLSKQPFCPVCRHKLEPLFTQDETVHVKFGR
ncbi:hypothetical protein RND71_014133 [Anisodus tanguticus]|uniref:RING-type domain-containing protein n=1 Tax=Anisodus tanguticus TaxID=243964 RepID=A0AAE1S9A0_9SOLA|nr:hypothetical protein RND71_014133 [Anisodus tanguticus]